MNSLSTKASQSLLNLTPFHLIPEEDGSYLLQSKKGAIKLTGSMLNQLVSRFFPLLNGEKNASEIAEILRPEQSDEKTEKLLSSLEQHGLIEHLTAPPASIASDELEYFHSLRKSLATEKECGWAAIDELRQSHVAIIGCNPISQALIENLSYLGVGRISIFGNEKVKISDVARTTSLTLSDVDQSWSEVLKRHNPLSRMRVDLVHLGDTPVSEKEWQTRLPEVNLVIASHHGASFFTESFKNLNKIALQRNLAFTVVSDIERVGLSVGPTMHGEDTACYRCFEIRYKSNLNQLELFQRLEDHVSSTGETVDYGTFAPTINILAALATHEIRDILLSDRLALSVGKMISLDFSKEYNIVAHNVLRVPRCDVCSDKQQINRVQSWA